MASSARTGISRRIASVLGRREYVVRVLYRTSVSRKSLSGLNRAEAVVGLADTLTIYASLRVRVEPGLDSNFIVFPA